MEDVAGAVLTLLTEVRQVERERAEARAWAWSDYHGELLYPWVSVVPGTSYDGDPDQPPDWLADPRTPDVQE